MKKNFFKKLSFVLALAMIVSVLAPAAGVFAAAAPKLNATKKYLHLSGEPGPNEFDFNIANKQKGWKYSWSSDNKNVVTVNKSGLATAKGVGTAKVSVKITNKDGEKVKTLSATVVVRDNIKTVKISNAPENNTLKVNESFDFNRSFVTLANSTKKTSSVTRWSVDKEGATINDSGVFTATVPGKYVVTARSFQSKAKYETWKVTADDTSSLILATDSIEVTVVPSIVSVKQYNRNKFNVTFDSDMSKTDLSKDTAKVYRVVNGTKVSTGAEKIKEITLDATGKVATVELYSNFTSKAEYVFEYDGATDGFKAATLELKEIASISFDDLSATVNKNTDLKEKVNGLNADGVIIYNAKDQADFASYISFSGDLTNGYLDNSAKAVYIYKEGYSATLTAKFEYYVYNETTKVYDKVTLSDTAVVTGVNENNDVIASSLQFVVKDSAKVTSEVNASTSGWATTGFNLAAKDTGYFIGVRYKTHDDKDNYKYESIYTLTSKKLKFVSTNTDKLVINNNYLTAYSEGVVTVLVQTNDDKSTTISTFDITIQPERKFANATLDNHVVRVSNHSTYGQKASDGVVATITLLDTLNEKIYGVAGTQQLKVSPSGSTNEPVFTFVPSPTDKTDDDYGKIGIKLDTTGVAVHGTYNYEIPVTVDNTTKTVYLSIEVLDGRTTGNTTATSWRLELSDTTVDLKKIDSEKTITANVVGYNNKGARVNILTPGTGYTLTVKKDGNVMPTADWNKAGAAANVIQVVSGGSVSPFTTLEAGKTYLVEASLNASQAAAIGRVNSSGAGIAGVIGQATFTVTDTTTKSITLDDPTVATGSVLAMVQKAFSFYLNGDKLTDAEEDNIVEIVYNDGQADYTWPTTTTSYANGKNIHIKTVKYNVYNSNGTITQYKFDVNTTIKAEY